MRFLVDECTGPAVAQWLRDQAHEVFSVYDESRGLADDDVLAKANSEDWIVITNDKDFGEKVYRERWPHRGIVLLRLRDERFTAKVDALGRVIEDYADRLANAFVVATETHVRFGQM
jgi:predicted nuclease of predicted toxin-antitoxin system